MFTLRKTPRQQRSRETVGVILEGAAQVFDREGITATTNRIADRAGVSIGTVYQYFPNKEALLYALAGRHISLVYDRLAEAFDEAEYRLCCWEETAALLAQAIAGVHADRPVLHRVLHAYTPREPQIVAYHGDLLAESTGRLADQLRRTHRGEADPQHAAAMIVHAVDAQLHGVLLGGDGAAGLAEKLTRALVAHAPGRRGRSVDPSLS